MSRQKELICCGLSREVTIAVLPRLNMEELMFELNRRIQNLDKENSIKDRLVSILRDVMLEEYRQLESMSDSEVSSPDQTTIPMQGQKTTMQENTTTAESLSPDASQQSFGLEFVIKKERDTSSEMLMHTKPNELVLESNKPGEEEPSASCHLLPDNGDVPLEMECHVFEDDQIRQMSQASNPDQTEGNADGRETGFINVGLDQSGEESNEESSEETPFTHSFSKQRKCNKQEKPFMCGECGYRARHKYQLVGHMRTHTGEKSFKCNQCSYKTSFKRNLDKHMNRHTEAESYSCELCVYQTFRKSAFEAHKMGHTGVKPYKCEECDYSTAYKSDLIKHGRRHTGERPYSCQKCDYKATVISNLFSHMRKKHQ
ncbi:zinc finger protein 626-like [Branchiostoma floridae]|uniref:Zinc finger protein 626-like n=1 Tax=Branchiostoma floridae TaxID=7739 RepID=A0A9J7HME4_BRAFL|nr:zinc finger protein 626-like [Branchiostoma floridae]